MSRSQLLVLMAGTVLGVLGWSPARVEAAKYNVYYRPSATSPWTYYAGKGTDAAAQTTATELKDLGYQTVIIADGQAPPTTVLAPVPGATSVVPVPVGGVVSGGTSYVGGGTRVVTTGPTVSSSNYVGHSWSSHASTGSTVNSVTQHHYDHHHAGEAHHHHHPTHHPHHNIHHHHNKPHHAHHRHNPHHSHQAHHHGGHHAHHHGGHHAHHHAHHHSHAHHHGRH